MDCRDFRKLASKIYDGEADAAEGARLSKHLEECEDCSAFDSAIGEITALHGMMEKAAPPAGLVDAVLEGAGRETRMPDWWRAAVAVAAGVVIVLGVWTGGYLASNTGETTSVQQADLFDMKQLEPYPPGSLGETLERSLEGEADV